MLAAHHTSIPRLTMRPWPLALGSALLALSSTARGAPFVTEVAWMGTAASATDEWVEVVNAGAAPLDLSTYVLVEGGESHALPAITLPPGGYVVLEDNEEATSLMPSAAVVVGLSLNNSGESLRLCPTGQAENDAACDLVHAGGPWPAGSNTSKRTMVRDGALVLGQAVSWRTYDGPPSAVLDQDGLGLFGSPGGPEAPLDAGPEDAGLPDAGPEDAGLLDAGPEDAGAPPPFAYPGLAITEVYFNPPGSAESGKEWVEVANLSSAPIPLEGATFERLEGATSPTVARSATIEGTSFVLAPGERVVLAQTADLDVGICIGGPLVVLGSNLQLSNGGTQWVRVTAGGISNTVKYAGSGVPSVPEGRALALIDEALGNGEPMSLAAADCEYAPGLFGSPGVRNEECALGAVAPCSPNLDGGPFAADGGAGPVDGGLLPPPPMDAGPNAPPGVVLSAPAGAVQSEGVIDLVYSAADPDEGDAVEVALFYDVDGQGFDGVRIASGLPGGEGVVYTWDTRAVPAGSYHVFAVARDLRGDSAYAYAAGTIAIGGGTKGDVATIAIVEPDGVNDVNEGGRVRIRWEVALPDDADGAVSLFFDDDDEGLDGEPILAAVPVREVSDEEGPREYLWNPEGVPPGAYTIYAVLDWTRGQASAYSAFVQVGETVGCGCRASASGEASDLWLLGAAGLLGAMGRRRVRRTKAPRRLAGSDSAREPCCSVRAIGT